MRLEISQDEKHARAIALRARLTRLSDVHTKLRKLNAALANLAVAEPSKQLTLLESASKFVASIDPPPGVKPLLTVVGNELLSMKEGIIAKVVTPNDLMLISGVRAVKEVESLAAKAVQNINRLEAAASSALDDLHNSELLKKNQAFKEKIPAFNGREFVIGRAPIAFTFSKQQHTSIGYANQEALDRQGFKTDNLGGYTVIHNQMVIGIDSMAVYNRSVDEQGNPTITRQRGKDTAVTFKQGKPTRIVKAVDKKHIDVAKSILKMIERQYNVKYAFVSELGATLNGGQFFWVMSVPDLTRLNRAFPGSHTKIDKWGFAF